MPVLSVIFALAPAAMSVRTRSVYPNVTACESPAEGSAPFLSRSLTFSDIAAERSAFQGFGRCPCAPLITRVEAVVPRQEAAIITAFAVTFAPRESSSRTFSASGAAIMSRVVPRSVVLLGSRPASSNAASCFADPNSAVRIHAGVLFFLMRHDIALAPVRQRREHRHHGPRTSRRRTDTRLSRMGIQSKNIPGLTGAGEIIRVCTRQVPSGACVERRNFSPASTRIRDRHTRFVQRVERLTCRVSVGPKRDQIALRRRDLTRRTTGPNQAHQPKRRVFRR